jgi:16S rRNA (uracil1498-N3)-methyltransferase
MAGEKIATRLFVEQDLTSGAVLGLDHAQAHFLRSVLRLQAGALLAVFNGRDGEWLARLEGLGKGWASLEVTEKRRCQEAGPDLWLLFAPVKRTRIDFIAEKATELGVSRLWPVLTRYTDVARVNTERLRATAREAAEQCERLDLPRVEEPMPLNRLADSWPSERRLLLCAERGDALPIAEALEKLGRSPGPLAVMTGPEGGFAPSELDAVAQLPFVTPVSLGPRILKAETAALAALACCQALTGDWALRPPEGSGGED